MPDNSFPNLTRAAEDFTMVLFRRGSNESKLKRSWWCPSDASIAAYADSVAGKRKRSWVEFHLARCHRCRLVVADIIKAQRQFDLPCPPAHLIGKAVGLVEPGRSRRRWFWVPAGALAGIALLAALAAILRSRPELSILPPPAPPAPIVAEAKPAPSLQPATHDVVRGPRSAEPSPTVLSPHPGSIIQNQKLQFRWTPIPRSRAYELRILKADGDLVWQEETKESALQLPSDVVLKSGSYFLWITAFLDNGRTAKSAPVQFQIKR